jgi:hypothetical protein
MLQKYKILSQKNKLPLAKLSPAANNGLAKCGVKCKVELFCILSRQSQFYWLFSYISK